MGKRLDKVIGSKADRKALKGARANLANVSDREVAKNGGKPIADTNPAYGKANRKVLDAEKKLPFLGRW